MCLAKVAARLSFSRWISLKVISISVAWPWAPPRGLVDHDPGVGQGEALALGAGGQQVGAHGGALADAVGDDVVLHELHGVVDGQARGDAAAGAVDVDLDVLVRVLALEEEHLGHDGVGHVVVDGGAQEDDVVLQQARVDVVAALAAGRLLDDDGGIVAAGHGPSGWSIRIARRRLAGAFFAGPGQTATSWQRAFSPWAFPRRRALPSSPGPSSASPRQVLPSCGGLLRLFLGHRLGLLHRLLGRGSASGLAFGAFFAGLASCLMVVVVVAVGAVDMRRRGPRRRARHPPGPPGRHPPGRPRRSGSRGGRPRACAPARPGPRRRPCPAAPR